MKTSRLCLLIVALVLLQSSCGLASPEEKKAKHKERGIAYYDSGKLQEAVIEFSNVIQIDPKDADTHFRLAQTYIRWGGKERLLAAFHELSRVLELEPSHREAQLHLGALHLVGGEPDKARELAEKVLAGTPDSTEGLMLLAKSLIMKKDFAKGMAVYQKVIAQDSRNVSAYVGLAQAHVGAQNHAAAEEVLQRAVNVAPQSAEAWVALGDLYELKGASAKAQETYKRAIQAVPGNETLSFRLAEFYVRAQKLTEAEAVYADLARSNPKEEKYLLVLGEFYFSTGNREKALESFTQATQVNASSVVARDKLIGYYIDTGDFTQANKLVQAALEKNSKDFSARLLDARLRLIQGKNEEGLSILRGLAKEQPTSAMAHEFLGVALIQKQELREAQSELTEAVRLAPQAVSPRMYLAKVHLAHQSYDLAIEQAHAALQLNPRNASAVLILGEAYLGKGDVGKAQTALDSIAKAAPQYPGLQHQLGLVAKAQGKNTEAVAHFEGALKSNPTSFESLAEIMAIKMQEGKAGEVEKRISHQIELVPNSPTLYHLLGQYWVKVRENGKAVEAFQKTLELDPNMLPVYMNLGALYQQSGNLQEAEREYQAALKKNPSFIQAHMMLGIIEEGRKSSDKAKTHYEQALAVNPKFAPAANNLAWLLIEEGGNSDVALNYAQTARELRPNDPTIADTLGWIYYKKNVPLKAANMLKEAADKQRENPVIQYHYGMALAAKGETEQARKTLTYALKLSSTFPGVEETRKKLKELDQMKSH